MKVICAGVQKTGTKTMAEALTILGYNVHDVFQQYFLEKELWLKVLDNSATNEDYRRYLSDVDAVTDLPGNFLWEQILNAFPDSKVILTMRTTEDEWYRSVKMHFEVMNSFMPFHNYKILTYIFNNFFCGPIRRGFMDLSSAYCQAGLGMAQMWGTPREAILRTRYRQHNFYVKKTCPSENLLVFNVKDGWEPLCKFLGLPIPDKPFPSKNVKSQFAKDIAARTTDDDFGYGRKVLREVVIRCSVFLTIVIGLISFMVYYVYN